MDRKLYISKKKQKLIDAYNAKPIVVGDQVYVKSKDLGTLSSSNNPDRLEFCNVIDIVNGNLVLIMDYYGQNKKVTIKPELVAEKRIKHIGADPFSTDDSHIRFVAWDINSIIGSFDLDGEKRLYREPYIINGVSVKELNWNPFIYDKEGLKQYYQRPFVWTKKDNQLLIESIYNGIECGRVLIRLRSWKTLEKLTKAGETEVGFRDIVDGKQRLNAIRGFINDEYPDLHGNYYSDLSEEAQHKFGNNQQLSYAEMGDTATDEQVIKQFLKLNFSGKPQSQEHINHVKEIMKKL